MKIVATSDLHGHLPEIPPCDVLIIAGDVCFDSPVAEQRDWLKGPFSEWLRSLSADLILGIAGNHDFALEKDRLLGPSLPWNYLQDHGYRFRGKWFWGTPWVPNLSRWAFHLDDAGLDRKVDEIPSDTDIIISHGPPRKYCDFTVPQFGSVHVGFPGLNPVLKRIQPEMLICGHIHEGYGWMKHESGAHIFNVAHQTENYKPIQPPLELESLNDRVWRFPDTFPPGNRAKGRELSEDEYFQTRYG